MHPGQHQPGRRDWWLIAAAVLSVIALAAVLLVVVLRTTDQPAGSPAAPVTPPATATVTRPGPTVTSPVTPEPTPIPTDSATRALRPFLAAAVRLDRQLSTAAEAINASGPPWTAVGPEVARNVRNAALLPVDRAIPAGLPHELQQAVVLVLSDLSSRRFALASFEQTPPVTPHGTTADLLLELRNGHSAAARFDRDLASLRTLASTTAPIAAVPRDSRLTAEVLLLARYVHTANGGCESRGGTVVTRLPEIVWKQVPGLPDADGTIGGIAFSADLGSGGAWTVGLFAC